ncbi:hypothetical protein MWH06_01965 [Wolbachia pipientis]|nr:hypothetical protein MWH06_01965 [Wolbachia pipientis]
MLRDTAIHSRYDVGLQVSSQCVTLGSSLYYLVEIKSSGSQCQLLG